MFLDSDARKMTGQGLGPLTSSGRTHRVGLREEHPSLETEPETTPSLREALAPAALKAALVPGRPVFGNPWDSETDMLACFTAVTVIVPYLLWCGGELTSAIFGFGAHWSLGVFMVAALVGGAGFMTIVGRQRTSITVDLLAITAWVFLGLIIAPVLGLAPPAVAAVGTRAVTRATTRSIRNSQPL